MQVQHGGLLDSVVTGAQFGRVNVQYPALLHEQGRSLAALLALVAPGGALRFENQAGAGSDQARRSGFDPADYVMPSDAHAALIKDWDIRSTRDAPAHVTTGAGVAHNFDLVLKANIGSSSPTHHA